MNRCPVCGGASTCPAGRYQEVLPLLPGDAVELPHGQTPGEGWVPTHWRKRVTLWVREQKGPYRLLLVGTAQAARIARHYGVRGAWVGMATYAFFVLEVQAGEDHDD